MCLGLVFVNANPADANPDRAPIGVFIALGVALTIVLVLLYLAVPVSSDDLAYRRTNYYSGPFGGLGGFGAFGGSKYYGYRNLREDRDD